MLGPFVDYLNRYLHLTQAELAFIHEQLSTVTYPKGHVLLSAGEVSHYFYFNIAGCSRMFYLVDGEEKNTFFYQEEQFISSYESFVHQTPAPHSIVCIEESILVPISAANAAALLSFSPSFETLSRMLMEEEMVIYQQMLASFITMNAAQRYQKLLQEQPALLQRLPQYHIASYLGVNAETLSRIRKRLAQR